MAEYAPRSPDLTGAGYAPRSPDLSGLAATQYAPPSPNLSALGAPVQDIPAQQPLAQPSPYARYNTRPQHQQYLNIPGAPPTPVQMMPETMTPAKPRARRAPSTDDLGYSPQTPKAPGPGRGRRKKQKIEQVEEEAGKPAPGSLEGIEVKTKFPVARIKRIMQHDEEVGKVSQVTPTAVSKALELFMISIVLKSAEQARAKSSKKVTVSHMKTVVAAEPEFDFLSSVCEKYQDSSASKGRKKKEQQEEDEEE